MIEQGTVDIILKDYNVLIDGWNVFNKPVKHNLRTYNSIQKITTGQEDDYITGFSLDYPYFKTHCKMIAMDLSK